MTRAPINPTLIVWARERAGRTTEEFEKKFPKLPQWEAGTIQPTFKQADDFASSVHIPVGYLFLSEPPIESLPIPDFRTVAGKVKAKPSPNLLDTIRFCQERQHWYRYVARTKGIESLPFVESATQTSSPVRIAAQMHETLGFDVAARQNCSTWTDSLRMFISAADKAGILVMVSGVVASNTSRRLDPEEFRGIALSDPLAPLVFVNGTDAKAAQMFTLAHELAHLWLGTSALSNCTAKPTSGLHNDEVWCNAVAVEFLVPLTVLRKELLDNEPIPVALTRLARVFKVSSLVILRRLLDVGWLNRSAFKDAWREEIERLQNHKLRGVGGGDFYRTTLSRVGRRFAKALVVSTLEGHTLYRDAYRMLGIRRGTTFEEIARQVNSAQ